LNKDYKFWHEKDGGNLGTMEVVTIRGTKDPSGKLNRRRPYASWPGRRQEQFEQNLRTRFLNAEYNELKNVADGKTIE